MTQEEKAGKSKEKHDVKEDKKDELAQIEEEIQHKWATDKTDEACVIEGVEKYFVTFPYAYMNGKLHLGHMFSFGKADYITRYKRIRGYNALFPYAFHCTGMPIKAAADKLRDEIEGRRQTGQKEIMRSMGIEEEEIEKFADARKWLQYFPKEAERTLRQFGAPVDWRRSFITTEENYYYDSFVRWQFEKLREQGRVSFGKRHTVYCPKDKQPCMDHDRQIGEGVLPQEYSVVEAEVEIEEKTYILLCTEKGEAKDKAVKCIVAEHEEYCIAVLDSKEREVVCTERAAANMQAQEHTVEIKRRIKGSKIAGKVCRVHGEEVQIEGTTRTEGTGLPATGIVLVRKNSEESSKESSKEDAERSVDEKVCVETRMAYFEPASRVVSRSGAECVVALVDQWHINYGEETWKKLAKECIDEMEMTAETKEAMYSGLDWLTKWACSRSYGLGTKVPWDTEYVIDSLSDSTIYMAFYTVKQYLCKDMYGKEEIVPKEQVDSAFWDCMFGTEAEYSKAIEKKKECAETVQRMRDEFRYFYGVDVRVSGKDLINNHLLFFVYVHVSVFGKQMWPKSVYTNGHIMLDNEKMSKSTGNFLTGEEAVKKYGADAVRLVLASCGDTNQDCNFSQQICNATVLRLHKILKTMQSAMAALVSTKIEQSIDVHIAEMEEELDKGVGACMTEESLLYTRIKEIKNKCIAAYEKMQYREVVMHGFYALETAIEQYVRETQESSTEQNKVLVLYAYIVFLAVNHPVIPHITEHIAQKVYKTNSIVFRRAEVLKQTEVAQHILQLGQWIERVCVHTKKAVQKQKKKGSIQSVELVFLDTLLPWQNRANELSREGIKKEDWSIYSTTLPEVLQYVSSGVCILPHRIEAIQHTKEKIAKMVEVEEVKIVESSTGGIDLPKVVCNIKKKE